MAFQYDLIVELVPPSECREFGARKLGKGVKVKAIDGQSYEVGGYTDSNESQGGEQARRRGFLTEPDVPQRRTRLGHAAAGRAEAARRFGTQARR